VDPDSFAFALSLQTCRRPVDYSATDPAAFHGILDARICLPLWFYINRAPSTLCRFVTWVLSTRRQLVPGLKYRGNCRRSLTSSPEWHWAAYDIQGSRISSFTKQWIAHEYNKPRRTYRIPSARKAKVLPFGPLPSRSSGFLIYPVVYLISSSNRG
jgi:hypothetical protein